MKWPRNHCTNQLAIFSNHFWFWSICFYSRHSVPSKNHWQGVLSTLLAQWLLVHLVIIAKVIYYWVVAFSWGFHSGYRLWNSDIFQSSPLLGVIFFFTFKNRFLTETTKTELYHFLPSFSSIQALPNTLFGIPPMNSHSQVDRLFSYIIVIHRYIHIYYMCTHARGKIHIEPTCWLCLCSWQPQMYTCYTCVVAGWHYVAFGKS